jgi:hypothetical protein
VSESDAPEGMRYSLVYNRSDKSVRDSIRLRIRMSYHVISFNKELNDLEQIIYSELGVKEDRMLKLSKKWPEFFEILSLSDFLDTITLAAVYDRGIREGYKIKGFANAVKEIDGRIAMYVAGVNRIFSEEAAPYRADSDAGIHPMIDASFSALQTAAIQGMNGARYAAERQSIENADRALLQSPPDMTQAIRHVFNASENLFKKLFQKSPRLASDQIDQYLRPHLDAKLAETPARVAAQKELESFKRWVEAAHFYRHEQGRPEPHQPPEDIGVLLISQGLSFTRWLVAIDDANHSATCAA